MDGRKEGSKGSSQRPTHVLLPLSVLGSGQESPFSSLSFLPPLLFGLVSQVFLPGRPSQSVRLTLSFPLLALGSFLLDGGRGRLVRDKHGDMFSPRLALLVQNTQLLNNHSLL